MLKQRHQLFVSLFALIDAAVVTGACMLAWMIRRLTIDGGFPADWRAWVKEPLWLIAIPLTLASMWAFGLYRPRRDRSMWIELFQITKASVLAMGVLVVLLWSVGVDSLVGSSGGGSAESMVPAGRVQIGALAVLLPMMLGLFHATLRVTLRSLRRRGWNQRHVAIIGVGRLGQIAARTLTRNAWTGIQVAYFISHEPTSERDECHNRPVAGGLDDLETILEEQHVDAVYLALPTAQTALMPDLLRRLERFAIDVRIIPDVPLRYLPQSMAVSELEGMPILSYRDCPLYGLGGVTKRAVDMGGALLAMTVFMPVMVLVAAAIRLTTPGPIIFRQRRVSLGGEEFWIYKFRTMFHVKDEAMIDLSPDDDASDTALDSHADATSAWTDRNDPRITPLGRFLRRTSLDELPQLLNVFRGEMSLVGPRPERPELIERFRDDWRGYMLRQHVKAGMTGWAQVNGLRGDTNLRKRLQHDLFYVRHWSVGFDLKILWLTIFRGFVHHNAH